MKNFVRWSQAQPEDMLCHPNAVAQAMAMEQHGYEQVGGPEDLSDQEDVMMLDGATGGVAPGRYHRVGDDVDANGRRSEHVFEAWPGSAHSDMLPWSKSLRRTQEGEMVPRLAVFRANRPEHAGHGLPLYAARERIGR